MNLDRFLSAQEKSYNTALSEIKAGRKRSHGMWYIFPQISGLGYSVTARFYEIKDANEAKEYVQHPILFPRLVEISEELLKLECNDATKVFGFPDNMKLKSSMTLFAQVSDSPVFMQVINKFFNGELCEFTVNAIKNN